MAENIRMESMPEVQHSSGTDTAVGIAVDMHTAPAAAVLDALATHAAEQHVQH